MSDSWTKALGTGALCLVVGFAAGVGWDRVDRDAPAQGLPAGPTATRTEAAADSAVVAPSPESAQVPRTSTPVEFDQVAADPQVAQQMAVAQASGNAGDLVLTPLNRTDAGDQQAWQPAESIAPQESRAALAELPAQSSQLAAQSQAADRPQ